MPRRSTQQCSAPMIGVLALMAALCVQVVALPPQLSADIPEVTELDDLDHKLSAGVADIVQELKHGDFPNPRRLGESSPGKRSRHRLYQEASLHAKLDSTEASLRKLEAGAEASLREQRRVDRMAMQDSVQTESRRERKDRAKLERKLSKLRASDAEWQDNIAAKLKQVGAEAAQQERTNSQVIQVEKQISSNAQNGDARDIQIPSKVLSRSELGSSHIAAKLEAIQQTSEKLASKLSSTHATNMGESVAAQGNRISKLQAQVADAEATKAVVQQNVNEALSHEHKQTSRSIQHKLSHMRMDEEGKEALTQQQMTEEQQHEHKLEDRVQGEMHTMEAEAEQVQQSAQHQFEEFQSILEESATKRQKADEKLSNLEAMMAALKTQRSLRLMGSTQEL